jgi:hypothetical protein
MTAPIPVAITSDGNLKVVYVPTLADPTAPTATEVTAVDTVDATCYLTGDGWAQTTDEQVVTDERLCSRQTFEDLGRFTDKLVLKYIFRQQEPTAVDNKAFNVFKRGVEGYLVARWGLAFEGDLAAADIVDVIPVVFDTQQKQTVAPNEKLKVMQNARITSTVQRDVVIVA